MPTFILEKPVRLKCAGEFVLVAADLAAGVHLREETVDAGSIKDSRWDGDACMALQFAHGLPEELVQVVCGAVAHRVDAHHALLHTHAGAHVSCRARAITPLQADTHPTVALLANLQRAIPTDGVLCLCEAKTAGAAPGVDALQTEIDTDRQTETDRQRQTGTDTQT